jgi:Zn-dependent oligopeptidase
MTVESSQSETKTLCYQLSADREREALEQFVRESGDDVKIEAWDWRYYAEKVITLVALIQFADLSDSC